MLYLKLSILSIVPLAAILLTGCRDTHAHQPPTRPSTETTASPSPASTESAHSSKHAPRNPSLSTYTNPAYALSFTYPINFDLQEFSALDPSDDSDFPPLPGQPAALPIASISIPGDAYPNTTFSSGSLQLFINPSATPAACRAFSAPPPDSSLSGSVPLQGLTFHWRETISHAVPVSTESVSPSLTSSFSNSVSSTSASSSPDSLAPVSDSSTAPASSESTRLYSAYSHNACYEFLAQLSSAPPLDPDSTARPADFHKIFLHLQKIISSFQLHPSETRTQ